MPCSFSLTIPAARLQRPTVWYSSNGLCRHMLTTRGWDVPTGHLDMLVRSQEPWQASNKPPTQASCDLQSPGTGKGCGNRARQPSGPGSTRKSPSSTLNRTAESTICTVSMSGR